MLLENLTHFCLVILIQFIFFAIHAYGVGEQRNIGTYLKRGMMLGLPFGIIFDLIIGHWIGMYDYVLGYTWWFLNLNGLFSWGFMVANIFLLQHHTIRHMYIWTIGIGLVYEISNYFLPVWEWTFLVSPTIEYLVIIFAAYAGLTVGIMLAMRLTYKLHFRLLPL